ENLRQCVGAAGVDVVQFVLNPLASGDVVLNDTEKQMGAAVCDIGGGTTDLALYVDGSVWHTMVLAVGGNHITADIAHGLRLPLSQAEEVKLKYGYAVKSDIGREQVFSIKPFGEEHAVEINRQELADIIEARVEELFSLVMQEIKRSGYDGLLPAGMVLTGGTSALSGIRKLAGSALNMPVRTAKPENLVGLTDSLGSPAYSTSVGLLHWAAGLQDMDIPPARDRPRRRVKGESSMDLTVVKNWLKRLLP
ncbi:MAG: cell division protein FtsA, partial [Chloroflexi bacterium]|nr:cell division protein FtsA [Chloroflexota bacterium]